MNASVVDVAARAGVSLGTVSNVLNRPERVAAATRERVQLAMTELGYVRNEAARQLRAGRSRMIGVVVLDVRNPYFTDVAAGVQDAARDAALSMVLCNSGNDTDTESHYLSMLQEQRAFGVLITPVGMPRRPIEELRRLGTPVVLLDRAAAADRQCSVSVDDRVGGRLAMAHLIDTGRRRPAFVGGPAALEQVRTRRDGASDALVTAGRPVSGLQVVEQRALDVESGRAAGAQLFSQPAARRPDGVFCANDLLALGVLQAALHHGVTVPGDVAIVGYDDIDFAAAAAVPLSSVGQPRAELGRAATELLLEEVEAPETHRHRRLVFEPELVVRESSASGSARR